MRGLGRGASLYCHARTDKEPKLSKRRLVCGQVRQGAHLDKCSEELNDRFHVPAPYTARAVPVFEPAHVATRRCHRQDNVWIIMDLEMRMTSERT